jgi:hypothetical protein
MSLKIAIDPRRLTPGAKYTVQWHHPSLGTVTDSRFFVRFIPAHSALSDADILKFYSGIDHGKVRTLKNDRVVFEKRFGGSGAYVVYPISDKNRMTIYMTDEHSEHHSEVEKINEQILAKVKEVASLKMRVRDLNRRKAVERGILLGTFRVEALSHSIYGDRDSGASINIHNSNLFPIRVCVEKAD